MLTTPLIVNKLKKLMCLLAASTTLLTLSTGAALAQNVLDNIEWKAIGNQQVEIRLTTSAQPAEPLAFTIDKPARISLDLLDTTLGQAKRRQEFGAGPIRSIFVAEAGGRTRVVLNLDELAPYATRIEGNQIVVAVGPESSAENTAAAAAAAAAEKTVATFEAPATIAQTPEAATARGISNIDFRRSEDGSGSVIVGLTNPNTQVDIQQEGNKVIAFFRDTDVAQELIKRLDVTDFATPVSTVDTLRDDNNVRVVITAGDEFEQIAYQSDNVFTVEMKPYVADADEQLAALEDNIEYNGERLSLNFQDIETRAVLQLLADVSGLNIVVSDTVVGNVTLRLQNVPWDQALDIVLKTKGLDMRQHGNVVIVAPAAEIANRERQQLEALQQVEELAPLRSEFVQVNYAKASDMQALISGSSGNALLSERGSVSVDARTNTLLIQDTVDKITEIRRLVQRLDIPVRQVLIESRIVIATDTFARDLGVSAGLGYLDEYGSDGLLAISGSAAGASALRAGQGINSNLSDRLNVNFPVQSSQEDENDTGGGGGETSARTAAGLAFAILDSDFLIDLELTALETENRGEVISAPRVITANQKEAYIEQGIEIPFQQAASSGATNIQFKKAVLGMRVTPLITPDDRVIMDLEVSKDSRGENVPTSGGGFVPAINTNRLETQILVEDSQTVVLGGVYDIAKEDIKSKVPIIGDIPLLGRLFQGSSSSNRKNELLIFVTPKILKDGTNIY